MSSLCIQQGSAETIIYVDDSNTSGPWDGTLAHPYQHIQDAINAATHGDIIFVLDGTYVENVNVNKRLTIQSEHGANVTDVEPANPNNDVFTINANTSIIGFTIENSNRYGIYVSSASLSVEYLTITNNGNYGIYINNGKNFTLKNCTIENNGGGITFNGYANGNTLVEHNTIQNNPGTALNIALTQLKTATIRHNTITNNAGTGVSVYISGTGGPATIIDNTITLCGDDGIYISGITNAIITDNTLSGTGSSHYGIHASSSNVYLEHLNITDFRSYGILIDSGKDFTLKNNTIENNIGGVTFSGNPSTGNALAEHNVIQNNTGTALSISLAQLKTATVRYNQINNNMAIGIGCSISGTGGKAWIENNTVKNSGNHGIYLSNVKGSHIAYNRVINSAQKGIYLSSSSQNFIYLNEFLDNNDNVYVSNSVNQWNTTEQVVYEYNGTIYQSYLGNYWDDYTGDDADRDGIGDDPYLIDGLNTDLYPLTQYFEKYHSVTSDTQIIMNQTASTSQNFSESIFAQRALVTASVEGDLNGTISFARLDIVRIASGSFNGKGFFKGNWSGTIEGLNVQGQLQGFLFNISDERTIYLKGKFSGGLKGILEGYLTESINGSDVYDRLHSTATINEFDTELVFAVCEVNGTLQYQWSNQYPSELYTMQIFIEGQASGYYNGSLDVVMTHVRINDQTNPYNGNGFSIISYNSEIGAGIGWSCDTLQTSEVVELNGIFTESLRGIILGILTENGSIKTLSLAIDRIDIGSPPAAHLKVRTWGPERVSPGQIVTYNIEFRNDGEKSSNTTIIIMDLPYETTYLSNSDNGAYNSNSHQVFWWLGNVPPKTLKTFTVNCRLAWGLPSMTIIEPIVSIPMESYVVILDQNASVGYRIILANETYKKGETTASNQSVNTLFFTDMYFDPIDHEIEPQVQYIEEGENVTITFQYTIGGQARGDFDFVLGIIKGVKVGIDIIKGVKDGSETKVSIDEMDNFLKWLVENGYLCQEKYADVLQSYKGKWAKVFIKPLASGNVIGDTDLAFKNWDVIFLRQLLNTMNVCPGYADPPTSQQELKQLHQRYLKEESHDISTTESQVIVARDPNIKYGPEGKITPGQKLNYTIEYENEGAGVAFGVYFTDTLDEDLIDSTLQIGPVISTTNHSVIAPPGFYNPQTRTITWFVGEVGPNEGGYANVSINVRSDQQEGVEVINYATVYFPSVPEETRTNAIVSFVDVKPPRYSHVNQDTDEVDVGGLVNVYAFWQDGMQLNYTWLEFYENGQWQTTDYFYYFVNESWSNFTIITKQGGQVFWRIRANDIAGNENITPMFSFTVISMNAPILFNENPANNSINVLRPPAELKATVEHPDGLPMNVYIKWKNHSGQWVTLQTYTGVDNGTYNFIPPTTNDWTWGNTTYMWSVNVTDGTVWVNETYSFTTGGSRYDVNNNNVVNFQDAGLVWTHRTSIVPYDALYDVNSNGQVNFQDAGLTWVNRD